MSICKNVEQELARKLDEFLPCYVPTDTESFAYKILGKIKSILWLIEPEQQNSYYDPSRSSNGGGYDQPLYEFEYGNVKLTYSDTSCGDFGDRIEVELTAGNTSYVYCLDTVGGSYEYAVHKFLDKETVLIQDWY